MIDRHIVVSALRMAAGKRDRELRTGDRNVLWQRGCPHNAFLRRSHRTKQSRGYPKQKERQVQRP